MSTLARPRAHEAVRILGRSRFRRQVQRFFAADPFSAHSVRAVRARARITCEVRAQTCVSFGCDDRAKPQQYCSYFEAVFNRIGATEERPKMACVWDAKT